MSTMAFGIRVESEGICIAVAEAGEDLDYDGNEDIIEDVLPELDGLGLGYAMTSESTAYFKGDFTEDMLDQIRERLTDAGYVEEPLNL